MTKLKVLLLSLIVGLACFLLNTKQAAAQTPDFEAEFTAYASNHTVEELTQYANGRIAGITAEAIAEELGTQLLFIGDSPCMQAKKEICWNQFIIKLLQQTGITAAAGTACVLATPAIGKWGTALCISAVR